MIPPEITTSQALAVAAGLVPPAAGGRRLLGLTGPPGAGKSSFGRKLTAALAPHAVLVPMDGFHLATAELERLGRAERKGAPDTFDPAGFVALLRRLRAADEPVVYAPEFRRELEEPVAGAIPVAREVALVVVEGNYLLLGGDWEQARLLLDACWYLDLDDAERIRRLVRRHTSYGRSPAAARAWVRRTDEANAALIRARRHRADLVVRMPAGRGRSRS